jgi:hypothetical protein
MTVPVSALEIFSNYKTKIKHSHKLSCFSLNTQGNYEKGEKKMSHTQDTLTHGSGGHTTTGVDSIGW